MVCDGCGQIASSEHLAARFRRLEWATRYRPLHIGALLLGAVAPANDAEFIYTDAREFCGEAAWVLRVAGIDAAGKSADTIHHELQRAGFFVAHVMDCPLESAGGNGALGGLLAKRVAVTLTRIRRSIKPKRVAMIAPELDFSLKKFTTEALGCGVILDGSRAFKVDETGDGAERLRVALLHASTAAP
jgi:hypothetical protein